MKSVKNFVSAALLVFILAFTAFAGDIETPGVYAPPPPPHASVPAGTTTPETTTTDTEQTGAITVETSDYLVLETLKAILSVY